MVIPITAISTYFLDAVVSSKMKAGFERHL